MGFARRTDANHRDVAKAMEQAGFTVIDFSSVGRGVPDLYAAKAGRGLWVEVKDGSKVPSARKLTPDQLRFRERMARAGIHVYVVTSAEDAVRL